MVKLATNVTDPIGDLLARIRNANTAAKEELLVPVSKMNDAILKILATEGFSPRRTPRRRALATRVR